MNHNFLQRPPQRTLGPGNVPGSGRTRPVANNGMATTAEVPQWTCALGGRYFLLTIRLRAERSTALLIGLATVAVVAGRQCGGCATLDR
jgi:hypothetical protein